MNIHSRAVILALAFVSAIFVSTLALDEARAQTGVTVSILPVDTTVTVGDEFFVRVRVILPGSEFNAFDAVVEHDPSVLTIPTIGPTNDLGSLMVETQQAGAARCPTPPTPPTCACNCPSLPLYQVQQLSTSRSLTTSSILCCDTFTNGPGVLYLLKFKAPNAPVAATTISFRPDVSPGLQFYRAGFLVLPVTSTNATIHFIPQVPVELSRFTIE